MASSPPPLVGQSGSPQNNSFPSICSTAFTLSDYANTLTLNMASDFSIGAANDSLPAIFALGTKSREFGVDDVHSLYLDKQPCIFFPFLYCEPSDFWETDGWNVDGFGEVKYDSYEGADVFWICEAAAVSEYFPDFLKVPQRASVVMDPVAGFGIAQGTGRCEELRLVAKFAEEVADDAEESTTSAIPTATGTSATSSGTAAVTESSGGATTSRLCKKMGVLLTAFVTMGLVVA